MVALLTAGAVISLAIGASLDAAVILAIVTVNAGIDTSRSSGPRPPRRRCGGSSPARRASCAAAGSRRVPVEEIVTGDIVQLSAGDRVPAHGRLLEADALEIDEASLTGESLPVAKRAEPPVDAAASLSERLDMAFAGTVTTRGAASMAVSAIGGASTVGAIAAAAGRRSPRTPLQLRLDRLARVLLYAALAVCLGLTLLAWAYGETLAGSLLVGVSLAIAAVPEGLPAVVTVTLALGMRKMAEQGPIVRRLHAVETLGSTTCSDKTGTLTENRLALEDPRLRRDASRRAGCRHRPVDGRRPAGV